MDTMPLGTMQIMEAKFKEIVDVHVQELLARLEMSLEQHHSELSSRIAQVESHLGQSIHASLILQQQVLAMQGKMDLLDANVSEGLDGVPSSAAASNTHLHQSVVGRAGQQGRPMSPGPILLREIGARVGRVEAALETMWGHASQTEGRLPMATLARQDLDAILRPASSVAGIATVSEAENGTQVVEQPAETFSRLHAVASAIFKNNSESLTPRRRRPQRLSASGESNQQEPESPPDPLRADSPTRQRACLSLVRQALGKEDNASL